MRGFERPPWWALVVMAAAVAAIAVLAPSVLARGRVPESEIRRDQAAASAEAAAASSSAAAARGPSLAQLRADGDLSIYYIGDSITDGWNATVQSNGYRPQLTRLLSADGHVTETSTFRAGATLDDVRATAKLPTAVDVAVIELGTNDVGATTDPKAFGASYLQLVSALSAVSKRLVCVGVYRDGQYAKALDEQIAGICNTTGRVFVSITDLWHASGLVDPKGTPDYPGVADGGHPNDKGHTEIARRIDVALTNPAS